VGWEFGLSLNRAGDSHDTEDRRWRNVNTFVTGNAFDIRQRKLWAAPEPPGIKVTLKNREIAYGRSAHAV